MDTLSKILWLRTCMSFVQGFLEMFHYGKYNGKYKFWSFHISDCSSHGLLGVILCSLVVRYQCFGGTHFFHLQD
jgi:hypothetical protein